MASRSNVNSAPVVDNTSDDIDDLPAELDGDSTPTASMSNGEGSASSSAGMSLDELNSLGFDDKRDEAERVKLDPPTGDWEKDDRWKVEKSV